MPDITFILPHWIYWGSIFAVPVFFMFLTRQFPLHNYAPSLSTPIAYLFLITGGFAGIHRLYVKSRWAVVFIALFVGVLLCNHEARLARNAYSIANNDVFNAEYDLKTAEDEEAEGATLAELRQKIEVATTYSEELQKKWDDWRATSGWLAALILLLLVADAFLLPSMIRRRVATAALSPPPHPPPAMPEEKKALTDGGKFGRFVSRSNEFIGEFVSYWTVIAVFVFYYEVVARYVFNSPTIWAHESMFLLFGMQYMLAGGFCLRENAHVRVDVIYMLLSPRARAIADLLTSVVFFVFVTALIVTGWIFFSDSFGMRQVSFTEWEIPYWPIKFALPLGGALLALQGLVHVLRDAAVLLDKQATNKE